MNQFKYLISVLILFQCVYVINASNHLYYLTNTIQDQTGLLYQKVGTLNPTSSEVIAFKKFPVVGSYNLDSYTNCTTTSEDSLTNTLSYFPVNVSDSKVSTCTFSAPLLASNPIVSFTLGHNGEAFLITVVGYTSFLYSLILPTASSLCEVSLVQNFDFSSLSSRVIEPVNVLGSASIHNSTYYYLLVDFIGLIEMDSSNGTYDVVVPTRSDYYFVSLSSTIEKNSTLYYNEIYNVTSPKSMISKYNASSNQYSSVITLPYYISGLITTDSTNLNIYIYNQLNLFTYSISQNTVTSNTSVNLNVMKYNYLRNDTPYCPNGCSGNGKCGINGVCACDAGWTLSDCSLCNSGTYCSGHGICQVGTNSSRSCECIPGWNLPYCNTCDPSYLCNSNGKCSSQEGGQCTCNSGFYGSSCQYCNSTYLCNGHGVCNPNTTICECDVYWGSKDCSQFDLSETGVVDAIFTLNIIVFSLFLFFFVTSFVSTLFNHEISWLFLVTPTSVLASLNYLQSFALLTLNTDINHLFIKYFRYYYFFNFDFYRGLSLTSTYFYIESSCWMPKVIAFFLILATWKIMKNTKIRGILLQICLWFYFSFCISEFQRFQQCQSCSNTYNIIATLLALCILGSLVYLYYRMWKVVTRNKSYFETEADYWQTNIFLEPQPPAWFQYTSNVLKFVCYPPSGLLSTFFSRMCRVDYRSRFHPPLSKEEDHLSVNSWKPSQYLPTEKIEDFLALLAKKLDKEDLDISHIVNLLKGNWYTNVADLRNLSEQDAERLGIPLLLYRAIQEELPTDEEQKYTRITTLVKTDQRTRFLELYGCLASHYKITHVLFYIDHLLIRNLLWSLLFVALTSYKNYQLFAIVIVQFWYTVFLLWNRPYKRKRDLLEAVFPEFVLLTTICFLIYLSFHPYHYKVLLVIPILNLIAVLGSFLPHAITYCYLTSKPDEMEHTPLLKQRFSQIDKTTNTMYT